MDVNSVNRANPMLIIRRLSRPIFVEICHNTSATNISQCGSEKK